MPCREVGLPRRKVGLPGRQVGMPGRGVGVPGGRVGNPGRQVGKPARRVGEPGRDFGEPSVQVGGGVAREGFALDRDVGVVGLERLPADAAAVPVVERDVVLQTVGRPKRFGAVRAAGGHGGHVAILHVAAQARSAHHFAAQVARRENRR